MEKDEKKSPNSSENEFLEKYNLIYAKAKELCELLVTLPINCVVTVCGDDFWISQKYEKDDSFAE